MCDACKMSGGAFGIKQSGTKQVGGVAMVPLSYLNPTYREPSSSAGPHALYSEPGLARPSINATGGSRLRTRARKIRRTKKHNTRRNLKRKGGFFPPVSALGSFMQSAPRLAVPAAVTGYRMVRNYNKRNKSRRKN
uniref:Uncharacterized protein n=1 Tax=viral metagenome TaxID=1070528 RepID=A0A6C0ANN8_9ZZZZ